MNNMRIAVCDDEKQIVEHIEKLIVRYANIFDSEERRAEIAAANEARTELRHHKEAANCYAGL